MAKSSKVEDYWREHSIESLFKELTQLLVRRTPSDPAVAIVEHIQKKYPKSFKTMTQSDVKSESLNTTRRSSNQSQMSGIVAIPGMNSAFTDLLNKSASLPQANPGAIFKHLVFANRVGLQGIKLAKNLRTDRDILEEEVIKPIIESNVHGHHDNLNIMETHDEPTVPQIIKYKQNIHMESVRRNHREELAKVAKEQRERESFVRSDFAAKPEELLTQQEVDHDADELLKSTRSASHKSIVNSKEEEEILNDENIFQLKKQRERTRPKASKCNRNHRLTIDFQSTSKSKQDNRNCPFCGHALNKDNDHQQLSIKNQTSPLLQSAESTNTVGTIDDWFETDSESRTPTPPPPPLSADGSATFRRNLFQPIDDPVEHLPPTSKRSVTPRLSETGLFARSPSAKKLQTSNSSDHEN